MLYAILFSSNHRMYAAFYIMQCSRKQTGYAAGGKFTGPRRTGTLDIAREAIAPLYLPSGLYPGYHKSGLTATLEADNNIIANFDFCELTTGASSEHFPSPAEALVSESNDYDRNLLQDVGFLWMYHVKARIRENHKFIYNSFCPYILF